MHKAIILLLLTLCACSSHTKEADVLLTEINGSQDFLDSFDEFLQLRYGGTDKSEMTLKLCNEIRDLPSVEAAEEFIA